MEAVAGSLTPTRPIGYVTHYENRCRVGAE